MRIKFMAISLFLAVIFCISTSFKASTGASDNWVFLGDKKVGFGVDHDVIVFSNWKDDVRQVKLKVTDGPLRMYKMKIYFDNGNFQDVELRNRFTQGSESRIIDLDGGLRHLSKIEFWYETKGFRKGRSRVAVWGKK